MIMHKRARVRKCKGEGAPGCGRACVRTALALLHPRTLPLYFLLTSIPALACDVCQKNQPAPLRGITHGTGPQAAWDMPIIWTAVAIVGITLVLAVKMLVRPGERHSSHIKHRILHDGH